MGTDSLLAAGYARSGSVVLVAEEFDETAPAVSPDGRWLAYVSGESGRSEVDVRPFPIRMMGSGKSRPTVGSSPFGPTRGGSDPPKKLSTKLYETGQRLEVQLACKILNTMTRLGMPDSYWSDPYARGVGGP